VVSRAWHAPFSYAQLSGIVLGMHYKALCMTTVLINTHMLMAARDAGVERFFFSSSACVYAAVKQTSTAVAPLRE
jgi:nucleoside-diphosphate-sugar epimerase